MWKNRLRCRCSSDLQFIFALPVIAVIFVVVRRTCHKHDDNNNACFCPATRRNLSQVATSCCDKNNYKILLNLYTSKSKVHTDVAIKRLFEITVVGRPDCRSLSFWPWWILSKFLLWRRNQRHPCSDCRLRGYGVAGRCQILSFSVAFRRHPYNNFCLLYMITIIYLVKLS